MRLLFFFLLISACSTQNDWDHGEQKEVFEADEIKKLQNKALNDQNTAEDL